MNINENINIIEKTRNLIKLILSSSENSNNLFELLEQENNPIELISYFLEILSDFNNCILNLTPIQNLYILTYIKNTLPKYKAKPKLKDIENFENKILNSIKFYLNFNFAKKFSTEANNIYDKIKKIYDQIIPLLFDLLVVMEFKKTKNFLINFYNNEIKPYLNENNIDINDNFYYEFLIKIIHIYENFSRIYLIYIVKNEEMNILSEKFYKILKISRIYCIKDKFNNQEIKAKIINQCILSFSKITMLSLDHFIKSKIFKISSEIDNNNSNSNIEEKNFNFLENEFMFKFIDMIFSLDENNFSFGLEYDNNPEKKFFFLICKGKGVLIELLTVLIKKLSKFDFFNADINFNSKILKYFCDIVEYLITFYKKGKYPREKAENNEKEILQLSTIVKIINFIEEVIDNKIYNDLIESNNFVINNKNKNEKYGDIFKYIILPNILQTELEKTFFEINKEEYIKLVLDMSQKCQIKLPKHQSIKLLITMCENIDEFLTYIVKVYIYILKNISLNIDKDINIEKNYENLYFFLTQNIDNFNLIEQSLQILTSLFCLYMDKDYLSDFFCDEIDIINYMLIKINDPFLKSKLCIFYSYSLEILFHNDDEVLSKSYHDSLNFIFECVFHKIPSLQKTAFYSINSIVFNNYLKKFNVTSVDIYSLKVINFFNDKKNLEGFDEEFNIFLKGLVKEYMYDLGDNIIQLFDIFWNKFSNILKNNMNDKNNITKANEVLKDKTKEINQAMELNTLINIIKNFINMKLDKNLEMKKNIYEKILSLFNNLIAYINTDFEEDILELISTIIMDIKLLSDSYFDFFRVYLNSFNQGAKNNYEYKFEKYHIKFIFICLLGFKRSLILKENIKEILINQLNYRLLTIKRGIPLKKIIIENYIYCDLGLCIIFHFYDDLNKNNIIDLISIFYERMEKIPNSDFSLNNKLCMNIFLLLIKIDDYEIFDEIFIKKKKMNLYTFLNKIISFFPLNNLSLIEQQITAIFCSIIIRYLIIKQNNNQEILNVDKNDIHDNTLKKIYYYLFNLNLSELDIIKQKSLNMINKLNKKEEAENEKKNKEKFLELDNYEINGNNEKGHFKKNKNIIYPERKPHYDSIINRYNTNENDNNNENDKDNSVNYFSDEDEFLLMDEDNKRRFNNKNENDNDDGGYDDENDENINPKDNSDGENSDNDDRDQEFLTVKNDSKFSFSYYYNKFANEKLIINMREINEFKLFELMMKDIQYNDNNFLNEIFQNIKSSQGNDKLQLIEKYKGMHKIYFPDKNVYTYRRIVKIIRKNK